MRIQPESVKKILVVRNDRFGEFLLTVPAIRALREAFGRAQITAVVSPSVEALAGIVPCIDEVLVRPREPRQGVIERLRLARLLRSMGIDIAVMFNPSQEFNVATWLAGIPVRIGYDRKRGFLLTHTMKDEKHLGLKHEIDYNLELAGLIGAATKDHSLSLAPDASGGNILEGCGVTPADTLVAIHPWTSDPVKQWPKENFCLLAGQLHRETPVRVVVVGGSEHEEESRCFGRDERTINLTGKTTLPQLAGLLARCALLISGDSGPVHLSCAVSVPALVLFRNDMPGKNPRRWGPSCPGSAVIEKASLAEITVREVAVKAKEMLHII